MLMNWALADSADSEAWLAVRIKPVKMKKDLKKTTKQWKPKYSSSVTEQDQEHSSSQEING